MGYNLSEFERQFVERTLEIVEDYQGKYGATLLLNCLLGLLIVPKETVLVNNIPDDQVVELSKWGINPESIKNVGESRSGRPNPATLRGVVHSLRNAVAHFNITPIQTNGMATAFTFTDRNGFEATISLNEMREFVRRLARHLVSS